jgi:hypothetical protein
MPEKKKKNKKDTKVRKRDLKPQKDPKGGLFRFSPQGTSNQDVASRNW